MLEIDNPFPAEYGVVRLLESNDCDRTAVVKAILTGTYCRPYMIEEGDSRSLYFTRALTQSGMRLSDPTALEFVYTQMMMSFLLFVHQPKHVLMLGVGGGSLVKYCHRHLLASRLTAIEIDPDILAFRDQFMLPPDDARLQILLGDAANYLRSNDSNADVILIDAFDRDGFSSSVCTQDFYLHVRDALTPQGVMVANMVGPKDERFAHLDMVADVFSGNIIMLPVADDGNYLLFAFRDAAFEPRWRWIEGQVKGMKVRYGLDFPGFAAKLKRSRKDGYLQGALLLAE